MNYLETCRVTNPQGKEDTCAKFVIDDIATPFTLHNITEVNQEYALSFWIKSDAEGQLTVCGKPITTSNTWARHSIVFTATQTDVAYHFNLAGSYYVYQSQLERGNKATDWTPAPEDVDNDIKETDSVVRNDMVENNTNVVKDCEKIILTALEAYTETSDFETFKQTTESALQLMSEQMSLSFSKTIEEVESVNGELQKTVTTLEKYFDFSLEDGLIIKTGNGNEMQLQLDNDIISFLKNGVQFGWWDGVDFHTGNLIVEVNERAQFGNFAFVPRSDGSLSFLKVGDS